MPELPEVEVVKRSLRRKILNSIIKKVEIIDGRLRFNVNKHQIIKLLGKKITKIERRSKFLIFKIGNNFHMLVHLGMTGKFFFIDKEARKFKTSFYYNIKGDKEQKHDRVVFYLQGNQKLIYNDVREFGFIKFFKINNYKLINHLRNLGPEPLERNCNFKYLKNYISGRNRSIKDILMDQRCISGLGNIYVNEVLFLSKIRPLRKVQTLKDREIEEIILNIKKILKASIKLGGSSIKDFSSDNGKKGSFQQRFNVYGKEGEKCSNIDCSMSIIRTIISNRSSFYCSKCQK